MKPIKLTEKTKQENCMQKIVDNFNKFLFINSEPLVVSGVWGGAYYEYVEKTANTPAKLIVSRNIFKENTIDVLIRSLLEGCICHYGMCNGFHTQTFSNNRKNENFLSVCKTFNIKTERCNSKGYKIVGYDDSYKTFWLEEWKSYREWYRDFKCGNKPKSSTTLVPMQGISQFNKISYKCACPQCKKQIFACFSDNNPLNLICGDCFIRMQVSKEENNNV